MWKIYGLPGGYNYLMGFIWTTQPASLYAKQPFERATKRAPSNSTVPSNSNLSFPVLKGRNLEVEFQWQLPNTKHSESMPFILQQERLCSTYTFYEFIRPFGHQNKFISMYSVASEVSSKLIKPFLEFSLRWQV